MIEDYLYVYYSGQIRLKNIVEELDIATATFYRRLEKMGLHSKGYYYNQIDTGDPKLDDTLRTKYHSIIERSKGKTEHGAYNNSIKSNDYLTIIEYVELVKTNTDEIKTMWETYLNNNKDLKFAISVDRIDNDKPYYKDNIDFVTTGFNSWRRNIRPIKVTYQEKDSYFLSAEEASRYYGIRRQSIGDLLRGATYYGGKYGVDYSTLEEVLKANKVKDTKEYYFKVFKTKEID